MNKSIIFKGIALANFVVLLTVFLLYRNGSFNNFIYSNDTILTSPNGGTSIKTTNDSSSIKFDSLDVIRFSSSKSLVIIDDLKFNTDTTKMDSNSINLPKKEKEFMYSSKSGRIIDPSLFIQDSLKKEPKKKKNKKKK